jgi:hypothetical protein
VGPALWLGLVSFGLSAALGNYRQQRLRALHLGIWTLAGSAFLAGKQGRRSGWNGQRRARGCVVGAGAALLSCSRRTRSVTHLLP